MSTLDISMLPAGKLTAFLDGQIERRGNSVFLVV